ncbi:MAG TPA: hypothetical protein PKK43_09685 [Spirochaetota bacterium]|mgnify:CR=1 FL=1|nr:hypothetical protein [Spirochaetota bacterium]
MMKKIILSVLLTGLFAAGFIACETSQVQTAPIQNKGELADITIHPLNAAVDVGDDLELIAKGFDAQGNEVPIRPVWKQVSGIRYGFLQAPKEAGNKAFITGVSKGKARIGIEVQGFSLEVDVIIRNVSQEKAGKSFK